MTRRQRAAAGLRRRPCIPATAVAPWTGWRALLVILLVSLGSGCGTPDAPTGAGGQLTPARRIVTLSPHLAELVFSAGAGGHLVGVVEFSDFPPEARSLPRVGDAFRVDYEAVVALRPDLVLAWTSGNPPETVQRLRTLGFRVVSLEPGALDDIGAHIAEIGTLAGTAVPAGEAADRFRSRLARLRERPAPVPAARVFIQLSQRPYFTVTDRHFLGQGLRLCGGHNVFGDLPGLTAIISMESIIEAAPEVIIASDMGGNAGEPLAAWQAWQQIPAVNQRRLYTLDADLLSRPSARILDGVEKLCRLLDPA